MSKRIVATTNVDTMREVIYQLEQIPEYSDAVDELIDKYANGDYANLSDDVIKKIYNDIQKARILGSANIQRTQTIEAAAGDTEPEYTFKDLLDDIKDDFDFLLDGLTLLDRDGVNDSHTIAQDLQADIKGFIGDIADKLDDVEQR